MLNLPVKNIRRIRVFIFFILQIFSCFLYGQYEITFKYPLKLVAKEKVSASIKKESIITAFGLGHAEIDGFSTTTILAKGSDGNIANFDYKKLILFDFLEIDNITKVWDKHLLKNGTYFNLLSRGEQYDLRSDLDREAIEYINSINNNDGFYNDTYFEDYLYTIVNKMHEGVLRDKRPGNIYFKIYKGPEPNAISLPNGCILISTGLLSTIKSEDELVGIIAHEVAHFVLDHQVLNFNKDIDRKKKAEFWATFATVLAASADAYMTVNSKNHIPGVLTTSTAVLASVISDEVVNRLGIKYSHVQEIEADNVAKELLKVLKYNDLGLSAALQRIRNYCVITGNYFALSASGSHPSIDSRVMQLGEVNDLDVFEQPSFLKKVSLVNSYNAWVELWYYSHHSAAYDLASRNIKNGVATESDYIVSAVVLRRLLNNKESNEEVISFLNKAKLLNVTPNIILFKEEGITLLRLGKNSEAKISFQTYLNSLVKLQEGHINNKNNYIEEEIVWTKKMIFKADKL
jgi:beta-barrel assembly-enhancing protease